MVVGMADVSLERRAAVRASNLEIVREAEQGDFGSRVPLICECGDVACVGFARMEVDGFNVAATQPSWFIVGDAHGAR